MDLSIIIVTYNSSAYIQACLRSILEQMREIDHEVIIVDNASSDETIRMIEQEFPRVTLIPNPLNLGFARANNLGLQKARGEFVLLINPDTRWKRGDIRKAIQSFGRPSGDRRPGMPAHPGRWLLAEISWEFSDSRQRTEGGLLSAKAISTVAMLPGNVHLQGESRGRAGGLGGWRVLPVQKRRGSGNGRL